MVAVEDDVLCVGPPESGDPCLSESPEEGVQHVALPAPVGADDHVDSPLQDHLLTVGERFETEQVDLFQVSHGYGPSIIGEKGEREKGASAQCR